MAGLTALTMGLSKQDGNKLFTAKPEAPA